MEFAFNRLTWVSADNSYRMFHESEQEYSVVQNVVWISLGAILGANARYFLSRWAARSLSPAFPYGTLIINVTGSFVIAVFLFYTSERVLVDPRWRMLVAIGFCGAYTTFSSYAFETMYYFQQGHWYLFAANILANNILCLAAVLAGAALAKAI
jgi:CrcB protein